MRDYQRKQLPFEMVLRGRQRRGNECAMLLGVDDRFGSPSARSPGPDGLAGAVTCCQIGQ